MKKSELKQKYQAYLKMMPGVVTQIAGSYLPELPHCQNFMKLAGRAIYLYSMPKNNDEHLDYTQARDALYSLITGVIQIEKYEFYYIHLHSYGKEYEAMLKEFNEQLYKKYNEQLVQAYIALMREEIKLGCVRIPVLCMPLFNHTKVQSRYGDWMVNYSPTITEVPALGKNAIQTAAKIFAESLLLETPCSVISVQFKSPVSEENVSLTQDVIRQFCDTANQFLREEFEDKKDNEDYRYRNDWNPKCIQKPCWHASWCYQ